MTEKIRFFQPPIQSGYFTNENDEPKNLIEDGRLKVNTGVITIIGTTNADNNQKEIGSDSTTILDENSGRKFADIVNDSDETIYISLADTAEMNKGIRLNANGGAYQINADNLYTGKVSGICVSGGKKVTYCESPASEEEPEPPVEGSCAACNPCGMILTEEDCSLCPICEWDPIAGECVPKEGAGTCEELNNMEDCVVCQGTWTPV